jgi:hypothetical protein
MTELVLVRATVNLPGLVCGQEALVDPSVPYIAECLEARLVVPADTEEVNDG